MPWKVYKDGAQYCVHKLTPGGGKGKKVSGGCHPSKAEAERHKRALYANEPKATHASAPVLVTVPNVPILEAGVEYELSTGPATFTPEDLRDAVTAAGEDPSIPLPRVKIGHIDPRYNGAAFDGDPAFGKYTNLRLSDNGMVVYADAVGVPKWLADLMPVAYPARSVEGYRNVQSGTGKTWRLVISDVASLGIKWPGITQLEDLPLYYGEEIPEGVVIDEEEIAAAAGEHVSATANLDDIRIAFYKEYVDAHQGEGARYWWVRAVLTDPNQLVIEDEDNGQLYLLSFSSDNKGAVSFGDPKAVRIEYVPDEKMKEAAAYVAATLINEREVVATWASRAESSPEVPQEGGTMDPKEVRKRLGLPEDATDEQVKAEIDKLNEAVGETDSEGEGTGNGEGEGEGAEGESGGSGTTTPAPAPATPTPPTQTPEAVAASGPGGKPAVQLDAGQFESLKASAAKGEAAYAKLQDVENGRVLDEAIQAGKIPPARREAWEKYMKSDRDGAIKAISELQAGLVPVQELGHQQGEGGEELPDFSANLFPEVRKRRTRDKLIQAGTQMPSRIQTDGALRRGSSI